MEKIDMEVDDFLSYCDYKGLATKTIRVYFNYMYENRLIKINPVQKVKVIKTPRKVKGYLDDKEINNLFKYFDSSKFHEYRDYVITQLIFDTGMRCGECLMIRD